MILSLLPGDVRAEAGMQLINRQLSSYFSRQLAVSQSDLEVRIINGPTIDFTDYIPQSIRVESRRSRPFIGLQTVALSFKTSAGQQRRYIVTVEVSVTGEVLTAARRINRDEALSADMLVVRRARLNNPDQDYFTKPSELTDKVAARVIKPGEILQSSMLKSLPDAQRGASVEIQIYKGNLMVSAEGRLKSDARVGQEVTVLCIETGKILTGVLATPNRVAIMDSRGNL
jgi:flagella basal body P-ring formation protein FlgA